MWIRKIFRIDYVNFIETIYNPLLGEAESEEERRNSGTPRGVLQSDNQGTSMILETPHPSTPSPPSSTPNTPTPTPPPPPPLPPFNMANAIKMLVFRRQGSEDPEQFWFVVKAI